MDEIIKILRGNALTEMKELPDESVHCVVTSPPYWGLRDYKVDGQIGLEKTPEEYVAHLVEVFREVKRVLRDDGTLWLNLGDSYAANRTYQVPDSKWCDVGNNKSSEIPDGLKPKDLVGIPWRVAFALQADGWYLRSDIIWSKPNPMPESVRDRPTKSHEYIFLLTKNARYFFDQEAVRERFTTPLHSPGNLVNCGVGERARTHPANEPDRVWGSLTGRNIRTVWEITTKPYPEAHFATFPEELPRRCIKAGTSEKGCCAECGASWERQTTRPKAPPELFTDRAAPTDGFVRSGSADYGAMVGHGQKLDLWRKQNPTKTMGWQPACSCGKEPVPCVVLDPFAGSGTTGAVARSLGRRAILIELNPEYIELIKKRTDYNVKNIMGFT